VLTFYYTDYNTLQGGAHFVVKHVDAFIQFEADLGHITIPSRPLQQPEQITPALEKISRT